MIRSVYQYTACKTRKCSAKSSLSPNVLRFGFEFSDYLVDGRQVASHLAVTVMHVELACEGQIFDVSHAATAATATATILHTVFFHRLSTGAIGANAALVDGKHGVIHGTRSTHRLPDLREIIDVVGDDDALGEHGHTVAALVDLIGIRDRE